MAQWSIYGPDKEWLSQADVMAWLGIESENTLRLMIEDGFPPGVRAGPQSPAKWHALDIACWHHLESRRMRKEVKPAPAKGGKKEPDDD